MASSRRPRRAMILLYICLILLTASWNTLAQLQGEEMDRCGAALRQADANDDLKIDEDEHLEFLRRFGSDGFLADLEERPLALRSKFYALACMCHQRGGDDECCNGDHAVIDIFGTRDGASQEDQDYMKTVCTLTKRTIDIVQNANTVAPSNRGGITSVWLRTTYHVATSGAGDFLSDLMDAMNTLVPEVLQEVTKERRRLQQVESLPTLLNSTPTDCPEGLSETDTCVEIKTTTYVVGPEDKLNQTALEGALTEAIMEGRLQSLLEEDTPIKVLDLAALVEQNDPTEAPIVPQEEGTDIIPTVSPADTGNDDSEQDGWHAGAIAGVAVAACVTVGLAVGLGLRRRSKKASAESFNSQESCLKESGSFANAFEPSDDGDTYLDIMESGREQQTMGSGNADNMHHVSFQMEKVGVENFDEEDVELLSPVNTPSTFFAIPTLRNSRQASNGDMGASDNHIDSLTYLPSTNSFEAIDSHGNSVGSLTPVGYGTAMRLPGDSDSSSSSSLSSSSFESGTGSQLTYDDSMSESSSSSEEDYSPFKRELQALTSPVHKSGQTLDSMSAFHSEDNLVLDDSAKGGLGVANVATTLIVQSSSNVQGAPSEESAANGIPILSNDGPSTGAIAVATMGAVGVVAAGGAVVYAATREQGDDKGETEEETNPHVTETSFKPPPELQVGDGLNEAVALRAAGVGAACVFLAGAESFSTIEDPVAVGEESLMPLDCGLDGTPAAGAASFAAIHDPTAVDESESEDENQSECGSEYSSVIRDEEENETAGESQLSSRSDLDTSQTRYEATSVLGQPPREPSPAEEGLSAGAAAAIGAGTGTAVSRVGAIAAFLASRSRIEDDIRSENDTSRESGDISNDSQFDAGSRGADVPPAYERPRPLSSGKDHPYYAAAAAMTTGAGAAALYEANEASDDGEESEDESEGSDDDNESEGELVQQSSSDQALRPADEGDDDGVPIIAVSQAKDSPKELYNESQEDLKADDKEDFDISSIQTNDAEAKGISAESTVSSTNNDVSPVAAAIGAEALPAMALASAVPRANDSFENKRPDAKDSARQSGDSSSESGSDNASDEKSEGKATNVATLGIITDYSGTTFARSASIGDRSADTTAAIGASTRSTSECLLGSSIKDYSSSTGPRPHSATTSAAVLEGPCSTKKSASSSSRALGSPTSSNTVTSDCSPKTGIIAGVAAGAAALGAAVVYTLARSTKDNEESESASGDEHTTDDEEESRDEESADSATNMAFSSSRSISKATIETSCTGGFLQGDSVGGFFNSESDPPISERDLAADVSGVEGLVVAKPPQDDKAPENASDKRLIYESDESSASGEALKEEVAAVPIVDTAPLHLAPTSRESAMQPKDSTNYESESDESSKPGEAPEEETFVSIVDTPALCATPPDRDFLMRSEESTDYESESNESSESGEAPKEEVVLPLVDTPPLLVPRATLMRSEESTYNEPGSDESCAPGEAREEKNITPVVDTTPLRAAPMSRKSSMRSQGYRSSRSSGLTSSGDNFVPIEEGTAVNSVDTARLRASFTNRESSMRSQGYQSSTTSGFTESGDTFIDMEEAAHSATPDDIIVLKSRFGVSQAVVASAHESKSNESDGSIVQEGYSDGSSSGTASYSGSDSDSESDSNSNSGSSYESDSNDSSDDSTTDSSKDEHECGANLKTQDVVPHDGIPPKMYTSGAQYLVGGPGNRAALLRARSDAALPAAPREESVAAMLATWDEGYDIREGDEDDAPEYESLLGVNARAGLVPIEETGLSDESSQGMSVSVEDPTAMQYDSSAALHYDSSIPIHYGSSTLLDFDYSLRTILEQSGDVSYDEPSESSPGGEVVIMRNGLDPISERSERCGSVSSTEEQPVKQRVTEVQDGSSGLLSSEYSGELSLDAISEPGHKMFQRDSSDASSNGVESLWEEGGTGERSAEEGSSVFLNIGSINQSTEQEPTLRSREKIEDESSEYGSSSDGSSSDYSTESDSTSEESEASSSSTSSTSCTPIPSAPISSPTSNSCSGALQGPDDSLDWKIAMSNEEHDASDAWVAISRATKTDLPSEVEGSADVAEWAVGRSLSALRVASAASSLSCESSRELPSRDDMSSGSEETVDV